MPAEYWCPQWRRQGGGRGGSCPPPPYDFRYIYIYIFFFFFLSAQRSVMAMIIPLPHYEIIVENFLKLKKKKCVEVPPAERLFQGWRKIFGLARHFAPPLSKHPGAAPGCPYDTNKMFRFKEIAIQGKIYLPETKKKI